MRVDLHCHSVYSDGTLSPRELVALAKRKKLDAFSLTDHDTMAGVKEAFAAGKEFDIKVISGIELSAYNGEEIHILGYGLDYMNQELQAEIGDVQCRRKKRNEKIIEKLNGFGMDVSVNELEKFTTNTPGRTHIAKLLVEKGYVSTVQEAFDKWIASDAPCFVSTFSRSCKEAIELILRYKGIPILAHPNQLRMDRKSFESFLEELISYGLMGVEALYYTHTPSDLKYYVGICEKYKLLVSGGSDYHGANRDSLLGQTDIELDERQIKILSNGVI